MGSCLEDAKLGADGSLGVWTFSSAPKAQHPIAQGCEERATLGNMNHERNPTGVASRSHVPIVIQRLFASRFLDEKPVSILVGWDGS